MIAFLSLLLHVVVSPFRMKARLEAEIILLRHQLNVLRRRVPSNPKLAVADRLLFAWLYRLFPAERQSFAPPKFGSLRFKGPSVPETGGPFAWLGLNLVARDSHQP